MLSVVIANYNGEKYLRQCLDSLVNQTFKDFNVVLVDDCSTDSSIQIINSYFDLLNLILIKSELNGGAAKARNIGVQSAITDWILILDSDDVFHPRKVEIYNKCILENPSAVLVTSNHSTIDVNGNIIRNYFYNNDNNYLKKSLRSFRAFPAHSSVAFKKFAYEEVGGYVSSFVPAEDYALMCKLSLIGDIFHINELLVFYRLHGASISNKLYSNLTQEEHAIIANLVIFHGFEPNDKLIILVKRFFDLDRFRSLVEFKSSFNGLKSIKRFEHIYFLFRILFERCFGMNDLRLVCVNKVLLKSNESINKKI